MFFPGDAASRRKVALGGRSSKEQDRQKLLEQTRLEREQRQRRRLCNHSAIVIQKFFRGRRAVAAERLALRHKFCATFGELGQKADKSVFKIQCSYLPQLLYFFSLNNSNDFWCLVGACNLLLRSLSETDNAVSLFTDGEYTAERAIIEHRVKRLARLCLLAINQHRDTFESKFVVPASLLRTGNGTEVLLDTIFLLTRDNLLWSRATLDYLLHKDLLFILRGLLLTLKAADATTLPREMPRLENILFSLALRDVQRPLDRKDPQSKFAFSAQILSIPLLWQRSPTFKQVAVSQGLWAQFIHMIAENYSEFLNTLPPASAPSFPSKICLLGNILEASGSALSQSDVTVQLVTDFANVARYLMEELPPYYFKSAENVTDEDGMEIDESALSMVPEPVLEQQLRYASHPDFLRNLVRVTFSQGNLLRNVQNASNSEPPSETEVAVISATCAFLYASFVVLPRSVVLTNLAYSAQLVPQLWHYIRRCHLSGRWPAMAVVWRTGPDGSTGAELLGALLPLAAFCPVYSYMLTTTDNEEFYEQQRPLKLDDAVQLVLILKEAIWQLRWILAPKLSAVGTTMQNMDTQVKHMSSQGVRQFVSDASSRLLAELHDRNSRRQFTSPETFHAREAIDESFFSQAEGENSRARELLRQAPYLIPFSSRVRVYTSQVSSARQSNSSPHPFSRSRITIRRDRIVEDAFAQLNALQEEFLRGTIRVSFVNELGVEEAGVDGGGIFKDFMENITKAAFDIQYGLFKETADHLLYPNPASHMVHDDHLSYFEFLGKVLGKAMFEGILVDIPFAPFFLSKLRKKHNYLHDLPSLDPELYRSLLFIKHYEGDISELGLYFVINDNEYGEQIEVELLPGGKDMPVNNTNVIRYIHLVANYRLNSQIRQQSSYFLHGFQQLIKPEWIDMFNEHELQVLISGSHEGMDVNDLRTNVHYAGGYHEHHPVIEMFWEVLKTLDSNLQQKFLKFVTGCSRGPLLGFKYLEPQFCIQRAAPEDAPDEALDRLPTSATCMNLLKLPPYKSKEAIREKLLYSITAGAGFDLS
ncbi:hypothetical protein O6H91_17G053900 [Diphasiastrum complanatum]|uniref:Uncharacterized protein n=1 Tax=Diphasiastrum complanatum TaxID=34168 RepID=A0ACC2B6X1_DIPCM|nr:hypothetical protein O6H91_17G053900 [Diphasiastrum complanatum]